MSARILPCFKCGKHLESAFPPEHTDNNQPYAGTTFVSHGHYGSTVFDEMSDSYLELNLCDDCLRANASEVLRVTPIPAKAEYEYETWAVS